MTDRDSTHYFDVDDADLRRIGSAPREVKWHAHGATLTALSDRAVFSHGRLDKATAVLFDLAPPPPDHGTFLDIGCGWGAIALTLAKLAPAAQVYAIDINPRAVELTRSNAASAGFDNVRTMHPDAVHPGLTFDLIWSNPPIRIGKSGLHDLLDHWLNRLSPQGIACLVVGKNLGADSLAEWMVGRGFDVERLGSRKGFRVLRVSRSATPR